MDTGWLAILISVIALVVAVLSYIQQWRANEIEDRPVLYVMFKQIPAGKVDQVSEVRRIVLDGDSAVKLVNYSKAAADEDPVRHSSFIQVRNLGRAPALSVELRFRVTVSSTGLRGPSESHVFLPSIDPHGDAYFEIQTDLRGSYEFETLREASALDYRSIKYKRVAIAANGLFTVAGL